METVAVAFPKLNLEFNISRVAFTIGEFSVYWYAIFIAVGTILAVIYSMTQAKKYGIDSDKLMDIGIVAILVGIVGARAYYVIFNLDSYSSFAQMINIRDGGLAIYGGLIFGILAAFIVSRINKCRFIPSLDIAAGGFFIGQAIGRWGNFVNQEAFGCNTDSIFGMRSEQTAEYLRTNMWELYNEGVSVDPSMPVHPCFLYESVWCIIGFLIILLYRKFRKFDGEIFLFYCAWYGLGRGIIEGLRTDSLYIGVFKVSQLLSFAICLVAVILIVFFRIKIAKKRKTDPDYLMLYVNTEESRSQFLDDDETIIKKADSTLFEASQTLDTAQSKLDAILDGGEDNQSLEGMADETHDESFALISKLIDLSIAKISMASSLIDKFETAEDKEPEEISEDECEEEIVDEDTIEGKAKILQAQIDSARDFIDECYEIIENRKQLLVSEEESDVQEKEDEEIHDTVSDEADELDIPSPNENK